MRVIRLMEQPETPSDEGGQDYCVEALVLLHVAKMHSGFIVNG